MVCPRLFVYVADRENGRIQKFTRNGKFLGMWDELGKLFSLFKNRQGIWASVLLVGQNSVSAYVLKLDDTVGRVRGLVPVKGIHSLTLTEEGDIIMGGARVNVVLRYTPVDD